MFKITLMEDKVTFVTYIVHLRTLSVIDENTGGSRLHTHNPHTGHFNRRRKTHYAVHSAQIGWEDIMY
jgi:hypothetical protein